MDDLNQAGSKLRKTAILDAMTFGGQKPPNLDPKYEVTVKDKMFYHAITVQKCYDNYSFEELRYAAPAVQRQSENMLVRANNDGTYSANWTPGNVGSYKIHINIDGCDMAETFKVSPNLPQLTLGNYLIPALFKSLPIQIKSPALELRFIIFHCPVKLMSISIILPPRR